MGKTKVVMFGLAFLCVQVLVGKEGLQAQQRDVTDFIGRQDLTPADIVWGLTPRQTRGVRPSLAAIAMTVLFAYDSDAILPEAVQNLNSLGQALQSAALAPYRIRIVGHTDSIGSRHYNQGLSERRAQSVKQYLVNHFDIATARLITVGRGEEESLADNSTPAGRQKNRRVEFVNVGTP